MASGEHQERYVRVGGAKISYLKGGSGRPLVVLHSAEGNRGWLPCYDDLARNFTVSVPTHPGFAGSERPGWLESFFDLSRFYLWILQELDLGKPILVGHAMGGWLAAEIAVMSPQIVERLVLVDAAGVKPRNGEVLGIFFFGVGETRKLAFLDAKQVADYELLFVRKPTPEEREAQVINREEAARCCWKPYMPDPHLPHLLHRFRGFPAMMAGRRADNPGPLVYGSAT